jgi:hypothetical protein
MAGLWLRFVQGLKPWPRFGPEHQFMTFGPNGTAMMRQASEDMDRGYKKWATIRHEGLMNDFGRLSDDLCILRRAILWILEFPTAAYGHLRPPVGSPTA